VEQRFYSVSDDDKRRAVKQILKERGIKQAFVFVNSKLGCARLARSLEREGLKTAALHGDKSQDERLKALDAFKKGEVDLLVCTDVAARGLDIKDVPAVFNFDIPFNAEDYVHRIGRTGRAGASGLAVSFVGGNNDARLVGDIEKLIKTKIELVFGRDQRADALRTAETLNEQGYDNVVTLGTNAKMNEFCAVMGLGSLDGLDALVATNTANRAACRCALRGLPGVRLYEFDEDERNNFQYLIIEVDPQVCPLSRDELVQVLHAENVIARRYFTPGCHRSGPYRDMPRHRHDQLPVTEQLCDMLLALPTGAGVTTDEIAAIGGIIRTAIESADLTRAVLSARRIPSVAA
jgi:hypothetical protein